MQRFWGSLLLVILQAVLCSAQDKPATAPASGPTQLPIPIKLTDPRLYYIGRFDFTDTAGPRCQWSNSQVRIPFHGTDLQARIKTEENACFQVEVDGMPTTVLHPGKGEHLLDIARDLPAADHEIAIIKRTEAHTGVVQFLGFYANIGGKLTKLQRMTRCIEVIGDSVVSGYGNEGRGPDEHYLPEHQNAYMSFGPIAGRELNAEVMVTSWSFYPELIARYDQTVPFAKEEIKWDFTHQPDAIVVMVWVYGFNTGDPKDAEKFMARCKPFVQQIRQHNPQAVIYLATNPIITDDWPKDGQLFTKMREAIQKLEAELSAEGDAGISYLEFASQDNYHDGMGGDFCPTIKTHKKMARKLVETLKEDLNWQDAPATKVAP